MGGFRPLAAAIEEPAACGPVRHASAVGRMRQKARLDPCSCYQQIAEFFGVHFTTVGRIVRANRIRSHG